MQPRPVWIGVDGGATKFALHRIEEDASGALVTVGAGLECSWPSTPSAVTPSLEQQLQELEAGGPLLTSYERECSIAWPQALAEQLATFVGRAPVTLGLCMPGRKDAEARGITLMANGPRLPRFAADLEQELAACGVSLTTPLPAILSDGRAAGLGEELAAGGHLAGVQDAVLLGLGTGLAEAVKLGGRHLAVEQVEALHSPAHRRSLVSLEPALLVEGGDEQLSVEDAASLGGMQECFARTGGSGSLLDAAARGEDAAREVLRRGAVALASFLVERLQVLERAGAERVRVVLGQRAALIEREPGLASCWSQPLREVLERSSVPIESLRISELRAAPAIGALGVALGRIG